MNKIILLLRPHDLSILNENIGYEELKQIQIYSFNIEAAEIALKNGLTKVKVIADNKNLNFNTQKAHISADRMARAFDYESASLKKIYFNLDYNYNGWEYLNFYYFKYTQIKYELIINNLIDFLPEADEVIIVWTENEQDFYFDSKILRSIMIAKLYKKYKNISGYSSKNFQFFNDKAFDNSYRFPDAKFEILINLPATFYDYEKHRNRLDQKIYMDLQSPYFDVKYSDNRGKLVQAIDFDDGKYSYYKENYLKLLNFAIGEVDDNAKIQQGNRFYRRSIFQLENLIKIAELKYINDVKSIEMTDIDVGLQGPLFSIAERYGIAVNYWPHSKVTTSVLPVSEKIQVNKYFSMNESLELTIFGKIGYGKFNHINRIKRVNSLSSSPKKIMIFHNEMDDIAGLPLVNPDKLSFDYASLIYYLQSLDLIVKSRQKPSHFYNYQIPKIIEEAEGPLIDLLDWPDFCISIGTPTTALINFWEKGLPCIHLTYYELTETAKGTLPDDVMVINLTDNNWFEIFKKYMVDKIIKL